MSSIGYFEYSGTTTHDEKTDLYTNVKDFTNSDESVITITTVGKRGSWGTWEGNVKINKVNYDENIETTEEVFMLDGKRHGVSTTTKSDGSKEYARYNMGKRVGDKKKETNEILEYSAYQHLEYNSPWHLNTLNIFGFTDQYIEAYLDTIETVMSTYVFEESEFEDYYSDVLDEIRETHYEGLINTCQYFTFGRTLDLMKLAEFRLVTLDHYWSDNVGTYDIIKSKYPGYLQMLNAEGANNKDVEGFCTEYDKLLESYGSLDRNDPFFSDSTYVRMLRALETISEMDESFAASVALKNVDITSLGKNGLKDYSFVSPNLIREILDASPKDVSSLVYVSMLVHYLDAEVMMQSTRNSYVAANGIVVLPTVSTELYENNSSTTINGYVLEDGGADVSSRGIAWATTYNPTIDNDSKDIGAGIGDFSFEITGLTEGTTYFARAFATNSKGTKYGNCITFEAGSSLGIDDNEINKLDFTIYPNPA
ncbi:MAG: hypothetical protein KAH32_09095, partial [Chlamydiia bacterium]|nr:hypothetical protein [Chlamydiia bacterium]